MWGVRKRSKPKTRQNSEGRRLKAKIFFQFWKLEAHSALLSDSRSPTETCRPQRWSNFEHDGMVNGFCQSIIVVDGFSMVFVHVNHWCRWFFNGFSDFNHWYQWFFQCFFSNPTNPIFRQTNLTQCYKETSE